VIPLSDIPAYIHRACRKCGRLTRTRAKKVWKCPHCEAQNRIHHARALKPHRPKTYLKKDLNQFMEQEGPP
jgi:ribosomal protein L37AE/L43A